MEDITNTFNSSSARKVDDIRMQKMHKTKSKKLIFVSNLQPDLHDDVEIPVLVKDDQESLVKSPKNKEQQKLLHHKRSRLDMLDNSHLTSFPLVPPPLQIDHQKVTEILTSPEINAQECSNDTEGPGSSLNDAHLEGIDPIVLVEDYIQTKQLRRKKLSVLDLKTSLKKFDSSCPINVADTSDAPNYLDRVKTILSTKSSSLRTSNNSSRISSLESTMLTKCIVVEEEEEQARENFVKTIEEEEHEYINGSVTTEFFSSKTSQSIFSSSTSLHTLSSLSNPTIKLTDSFESPIVEFSLANSTTASIIPSSLKYCVICETPLYELSSHLPKDKDFNEFVCCSCTEKYEILSKLLDDFDESIMELMPIPEDIEDIEEALSQNRYPFKRVKLEDKSAFSVTLINKLQQQLNNGISSSSMSLSESDKKSIVWLLKAKKKLRWRWRINGLLPTFLTKDYD